MEVTLKELKIQPGKIVSTASSGTEVTVTVRGVPTVKIVPIRDQAKSKADFDTTSFGMWADRDDMVDVNDYVRNLRRGREL